MVYVQIPCCPSCGHTRYIKLKTLAGGDGSRCKRVICKRCVLRYIIVLELPPGTGGVGEGHE